MRKPICFKMRLSKATAVIYSEERFLKETMLAKDQEGFEYEQDFSVEAMRSAPIGSAMHLEVNDPSWATENLGEMIYFYTLWILNRMGNDPQGRKINRRGCVEHELAMPFGEKGMDGRQYP